MPKVVGIFVVVVVVVVVVVAIVVQFTFLRHLRGTLHSHPTVNYKNKIYKKLGGFYE
jgi:hypothetical protein